MLVSFPIMYFLVIKSVKDANYFREATVIQDSIKMTLTVRP